LDGEPLSIAQSFLMWKIATKRLILPSNSTLSPLANAQERDILDRGASPDRVGLFSFF
jgi:hypothetical protein